MARLLKHPQVADTKLIFQGENEKESKEIPVHSCVISARSDVLANMITPLEQNGNSTTDNANSDDVRLNGLPPLIDLAD